MANGRVRIAGTGNQGTGELRHVHIDEMASTTVREKKMRVNAADFVARRINQRRAGFSVFENASPNGATGRCAATTREK